MEAPIYSELYILERGQLSAILAPDSDRVPTLCDAPPFVTRLEYLPVGFDERQLVAARERLSNPQCHLLLMIGCPDGPPNRSGLIFTFQRQVNGISWRDGSCSHHGGVAKQFAVTTPQGSWQWIQDSRLGQPGYFLTGQSGESALWRLFRLEADALNRTVVTVAPIRMTAHCPTADFSSIADTRLQAELSQQFEDFSRSATAYAFRDVATKARNIAEGLLAYFLRTVNQNATARIWDDLQTVKRLREDDVTRPSCPVSEMQYHLLHKIRLAHARTHPDAGSTANAPLRPEFAMSIVEDIAEVLRGWGLVNP
jgi:hypothetical protein